MNLVCRYVKNVLLKTSFVANPYNRDNNQASVHGFHSSPEMHIKTHPKFGVCHIRYILLLWWRTSGILRWNPWAIYYGRKQGSPDRLYLDHIFPRSFIRRPRKYHWTHANHLNPQLGYKHGWCCAEFVVAEHVINWVKNHYQRKWFLLINDAQYLCRFPHVTWSVLVCILRTS